MRGFSAGWDAYENERRVIYYPARNTKQRFRVHYLYKYKGRRHGARGARA